MTEFENTSSLHFGDLDIENWNLFGIWDLIFGI